MLGLCGCCDGCCNRTIEKIIVKWGFGSITNIHTEIINKSLREMNCHYFYKIGTPGGFLNYTTPRLYSAGCDPASRPLADLIIIFTFSSPASAKRIDFASNGVLSTAELVPKATCQIDRTSDLTLQSFYWEDERFFGPTKLVVDNALPARSIAPTNSSGCTPTDADIRAHILSVMSDVGLDDVQVIRSDLPADSPIGEFTSSSGGVGRVETFYHLLIGLGPSSSTSIIHGGNSIGVSVNAAFTVEETTGYTTTTTHGVISYPPNTTGALLTGNCCLDRSIIVTRATNPVSGLGYEIQIVYAPDTSGTGCCKNPTCPNRVPEDDSLTPRVNVESDLKAMIGKVLLAFEGLTYFADSKLEDTDDDAMLPYANQDAVVTQLNQGCLDENKATVWNTSVTAGVIKRKAFVVRVKDQEELEITSLRSVTAGRSSPVLYDDASAGTIIGVIEIPSIVGDQIVYTLQSNFGGRFAITSEGVLSYIGTGSLSSFIGTSVPLTVLASSPGSSTVFKVIEVQILPASLKNPVLYDNSNTGVIIGRVDSLSSQDKAIYTLTDDFGGWFSISTDGVITFNATAIDLIGRAGTSVGITVLATSSTGQSESRIVDIPIVASTMYDSETDADELNETDSRINTRSDFTTGIDVEILGETGVVWSMESNPGGLFQVNSSTGVVTLKSTSTTALNMESAPYREIVIRGTKTDGSFELRRIALKVNDIDEFDTQLASSNPQSRIIPVDFAGVATLDLAEEGAVVARCRAYDLDATNNKITYSLTSDPQSVFSIDSVTGDISLSRDITTTTSSFTGTCGILATSQDGSTQSTTLTMSFGKSVTEKTDLLDEYVLPEDETDETSGNIVEENIQTRSEVPIKIRAFNPDFPYRKYTYSLDTALGGFSDGGRFSIDSVTGQVYSEVPLNYEKFQSHTIVVVAKAEDNITCTARIARAGDIVGRSPVEREETFAFEVSTVPFAELVVTRNTDITGATISTRYFDGVLQFSVRALITVVIDFVSLSGGGGGALGPIAPICSAGLLATEWLPLEQIYDEYEGGINACAMPTLTELRDWYAIRATYGGGDRLVLDIEEFPYTIKIDKDSP